MGDDPYLPEGAEQDPEYTKVSDITLQDGTTQTIVASGFVNGEVRTLWTLTSAMPITEEMRPILVESIMMAIGKVTGDEVDQ